MARSQKTIDTIHKLNPIFCEQCCFFLQISQKQMLNLVYSDDFFNAVINYQDNPSIVWNGWDDEVCGAL